MKTVCRACLAAVLWASVLLNVCAAMPSPAMAGASPDMQGVLDALAGMGGRPVETLDPAMARQQPTLADAAARLMLARGQHVEQMKEAMNVTTRDVTYPGAADEQQARIYRPLETGTDNLPVVLYIHGGGWVLGSIDSYDESARALARKANAMVVSIEYRHAPDYKFPAAHMDAFAAYKWLQENAPTYRGDPSRIAVVGEGAGANMAMNIAIQARDVAIGMPLFLGLIYPVAGIDMTTPSYVENEHAAPLDKAAMEWFMQNAFEKPEDSKSTRIDLVHADLMGLPQTAILTAEIDPLRSDGERLAEALNKQSNVVTIQNFTGVTHDFFGLDHVVAKAAKAQDMMAAELRKAFMQGAGQ